MSWDEPYTPVNHSVISYYIRVTDTYQAWISLLYDQLDPDTRSVRVTQMDPDSCSNLTMEVWAENTFGNGTAGEINGAFPASRLGCHCLHYQITACVVSCTHAQLLGYSKHELMLTFLAGASHADQTTQEPLDLPA